MTWIMILTKILNIAVIHKLPKVKHT